MLIQPKYLDQQMLAAFLASAEGGVRQSLSSRTSRSRGGGGSIGVSLLKAEGRLAGEEETSLTYEEHEVAGLQRLINAGKAHPEQYDWIEVGDPDVDFQDIGIGAILHWECDVYIPDSINAVSSPEMKRAMELMESMIPHASTLGLNMDGLPEAGQLSAMTSAIRSLDVAPVVIGERTETDWKIVGSLKQDCIADSAQFDNWVRVVAKVRKVIPEDGWHLLASLPGMNLLSRTERRKRERQGPQPGQEDQFLHGPGLVVDYLTIYS